MARVFDDATQLVLGHLLSPAGDDERAFSIERIVIDEPSTGVEGDPWLGQSLVHGA